MTSALPGSVRTEVCIIGAGPAGLVLANVLAANSVECIVLERHTREHTLARARAGLTAAKTVAILERHGLAGGVLAAGVSHDSIEFRSRASRVVFDYARLGACGPHYVYPQQRLVADLVTALEHRGGELRFGVRAERVEQDGSVEVHCRTVGGGSRLRVASELVAGCDGSHSVARRAMPVDRVGTHESQRAAAWLAVLAQAPPSTKRIIYAIHPRGFAGHMLRTQEVSRYYLEIGADDRIDDWPDERVWKELRARLAHPGWTLADGPIIDKQRVSLDSRIYEPMQHGRVYLAGDSAHVLTPAAARGMNLAIGDADALAQAMLARLRGEHDPAPLAGYGQRRRPDVLEAQAFSDLLLDVVGQAGPGRPMDEFYSRLATALGRQSIGSRDVAGFARRYAGESPALPAVSS